MGLEQKLDEEFILNKVEKEERKVMVLSIYEEGFAFLDTLLSIFFNLSGLDYYLPNEAADLRRKAMSNKNPLIRSYAVSSLQTLIEYNPKSVLELISIGLLDKDEEVRYSATEVLGNLTEENPYQIVELFDIGLKDTNSFVREGVIRNSSVLSRLNPKAAVKILNRGLSDPEIKVRIATVAYSSFLSEYNPEGTLNLLNKALLDPNKEVRKQVFHELSSLVEFKPEDVLDIFKKGLIDKNKIVRLASAAHLGVLAGYKPDDTLLLMKNNFSDKYLRIAITYNLEPLVKVKPNEALKLIKKSFSDKNKEVRIAATNSFKSLFKHNHNEAFELLSDGLLDVDIDVRINTIEKGLKHLYEHNKNLTFDLFTKCLSDLNNQIRAAATKQLYVLVKDRPDDALVLIKKGLSDPNEEVRTVTSGVLKSIVEYKPNESVELYRQIFLGKPSYNYKAKKVAALGLGNLAKYKLEDSLELFEIALSDSDYDVKYNAISCLSELIDINSDKAVELIKTRILDMGTDIGIETKVKTIDQVGKYLSVKNPKEALEFLKIGLNNEFKSVRYSALSWLGYLLYLNQNEFISLNQNEVLSLFRKEIKNFDIHFFSEGNSREILQNFYDNLGSFLDEKLTFQLEQHKHTFFINYLSSNLIYEDLEGVLRIKTNEEVIANLKEIIQDREFDYEKGLRILENGLVKTHNELLECADISIENYRATQRFGSGAFNNIYVAKNVVLEEDGLTLERILKVARKKIIMDSKMLDYILKENEQEKLEELNKKEAKILLSIRDDPNRNPYIVKIEEITKVKIGEYETFGIFLEDLRDTVSIDDYYKDKDISDFDFQFKILYQFEKISSALVYLEDYGLVAHNDPNPGNLRIRPDGTPVVIDFGLSKLVEYESRETGFRPFAPPSKTLAKYRDSWMLGSVIYYLLTDELPFEKGEEPTSTGWTERKFNKNPNFNLITTGFKEFDEGIIGILKKCYSGNYTINEFHKDLDNFKNHIENIYNEKLS